jgi:glycosyltransferase involved in cell wall biosynthesis
MTESAKIEINQSHQLSVVVPMYNEEENVIPLLARMHEALADYGHPWELILVNDGSSDRTLPTMITEGQKYGSHVRPVDLQRNFGQTAAMQAGIDVARGDVLVTMDGDLQNDPIDIPRLVKRLLEEDLDMVAGWRKNRKDDLVLRKIPSRIANRLIRRITGVHMHDYGCSLKVYRGKIIKDVRLYGEMHRFIPAWVATRTTPARIKEEVVTHHARQFGTSKYGISRTFRVILDLLSVYFFMRYKARPGHFFGSIGLGFGAIGALILTYLLAVKLFLGEDIGGRPLLLVGILFAVFSVQFLTTGVLSELISRTYFESGEQRSYTIRNQDELEQSSDQDWKQPA